jgi:diguanylate cyclase (GGDEF)-like protein
LGSQFRPDVAEPGLGVSAPASTGSKASAEVVPQPEPVREYVAKEPWMAVHGLDALRDDSLNQIWNGLTLLAIVATPASILRATTTGWLPLYSYFLVVGLLVLVISTLRRKFSYRSKLAMLVVLLWTIGIPGMMTFGVLATGVWWIAISGVLVSALDSERNGMLVFALTTVVISVIGLLFITGRLTMPPVEINSYGRSVTAWLTLLASTALMPMILMRAVAIHQRRIRELMGELEDERDRNSHLASHDYLTGLPSRSLATDRLQMAIHSASRHGRRMALLYLDIDDFKQLNDGFGHDAGDAGLCHVARCLGETLREDDTVARIGGDEFLVIVADVDTPQTAQAAAERMRQSIRQPFRHLDGTHRLDASIGIALYPDHAPDAAGLLRHADAEMYRAKVARKSKPDGEVAAV